METGDIGSTNIDNLITEITNRINQDTTKIHYLYFMAYKPNDPIGMPCVLIIRYIENIYHITTVKGIHINMDSDTISWCDVQKLGEIVHELQEIFKELKETYTFDSIELIYRKTPINEEQSGGNDNKLSIDPKEINEQTKLLIDDVDPHKNTISNASVSNKEPTATSSSKSNRGFSFSTSAAPSMEIIAAKTPPLSPLPPKTPSPQKDSNPNPNPIISPAVPPPPLREENKGTNLNNKDFGGPGGRKTRKNKKRKTKTIKNRNKNRNRKTKTRKNRNRNRNKNRKTKTRKNKKRKPKSRKNRQSK
jgi:hypothetical protein